MKRLRTSGLVAVLAVAATVALFRLQESASPEPGSAEPEFTSAPIEPSPTSQSAPGNAKQATRGVDATATVPVRTTAVRLRLLDATTERPLVEQKTRITVGSRASPRRILGRTDANGDVRIEAVPSGTHRLTIDAAQYLPLTRSITATESTPDAIVVPLQPAYALSGLVESASGAGLEGIHVRALLVRGARIATHRAVTDAEGKFSFGRLAPGQYRVEAASGAYLRNTTECLVPEDDSVRLVLQADPGFALRLLDASGRPISGARVRLLARATAATGRRVPVTDSDGWAQLAGVPPTGPDILLEVTHPDQDKRQLVLDAAARSTRHVTVTLDASAEVRGTVTDTAGHPIRSARVELVAASAAKSGEAFRRVLRSVTSGEFHFRDVPAGRYVLSVSSAGCRATHTISLTSGESAETTLTLEPGVTASHKPAPRLATLRGRIETTHSVAGTTLRVARVDDATLATRRHRFTAEDLDFRIRGLTPGTYEISLERDGDVLAHLEGVPVRPGEESDPIVLRLDS